MKLRVKVQIVLNAKEAQINRVLMHRAIQDDTRDHPRASKEERDFVNNYEKEISKAEGVLDVANGEAIATPVPGM